LKGIQEPVNPMNGEGEAIKQNGESNMNGGPRNDVNIVLKAYKCEKKCEFIYCITFSEFTF
jgi:hypothetical protein